MKRSEYNKRMAKYRNREANAYLLSIVFFAVFFIFIMKYIDWNDTLKGGASGLLIGGFIQAELFYHFLQVVARGSLVGSLICFFVGLYYSVKFFSLSQEIPEPDEGYYHVNMEITVTTVTPEDN